MNTFIRSMGLTAVITMTIWGILVSSIAAQEQEVIGGGRYLFEKFCKICHGPRALGNGPKAPSLLPKPANLTTLRQRNGGTFPFWQAYRMIDGRVDVPGHGTRDMPVFGVWFRIPDDEVSIETEWADQVRGRIWQLLSYLKSIQVP
jgi:mono/diheme cytochrome c family protein